MPKQRGIATRRTTILAGTSDFKLFIKSLFEFILITHS